MRVPYPTLTVMISAGAAMLFLGGCTTKNYVRQQTTPLVDHVNQLDTETAKNTNAIKDVDRNATAGIAAADQAADQANTHAQQVQTQAQALGQQLTQTGTQIQALDASMANLDDYKQSYQASVHFAFDKWNLTPEDQTTLDDVVQRLQGSQHQILEVEGYTDSTGTVAYNEGLSQRRADSVVRYLESKSVAPHRIFLIGLGPDQPVAPNTTKEGRQENRRVDLKIMINGLGASTSGTGTPQH